MKELYEIPVSTMEPRNLNYEVIGIVSTYHSSMYTKQIFGRDYTADDLAQEIIKKTVANAQKLGADAIYGLRIEMFPAPGMMGVNNNYLVYGTAIKIISWGESDRAKYFFDKREHWIKNI